MALSTKNIALIGGGASTILGGGVGTYYLLQDKTIKHKLIREGYSLISDDKEYQTAFKAFKDIEELTKLITTEEKTINAQSGIQEGATYLRKWCEKTLETNLSDTNIKNLIEKSQKYCTKAPSKIKDKLTRIGRTLITDWNAKLDALSSGPQNDDSLKNDLNQEDSKVTDFTTPDKETVANTLKKWCEKNIETPLASETVEAIWAKIDKRCLRPKE